MVHDNRRQLRASRIEGNNSKASVRSAERLDRSEKATRKRSGRRMGGGVKPLSKVFSRSCQGREATSIANIQCEKAAHEWLSVMQRMLIRPERRPSGSCPV